MRWFRVVDVCIESFFDENTEINYCTRVRCNWLSINSRLRNNCNRQQSYVKSCSIPYYLHPSNGWHNEGKLRVLITSSFRRIVPVNRWMIFLCFAAAKLLWRDRQKFKSLYFGQNGTCCDLNQCLCIRLISMYCFILFLSENFFLHFCHTTLILYCHGRRFNSFDYP